MRQPCNHLGRGGSLSGHMYLRVVTLFALHPHSNVSVHGVIAPPLLRSTCFSIVRIHEALWHQGSCDDNMPRQHCCHEKRSRLVKWKLYKKNNVCDTYRIIAESKAIKETIKPTRAIESYSSCKRHSWQRERATKARLVSNRQNKTSTTHTNMYPRT